MQAAYWDSSMKCDHLHTFDKKASQKYEQKALITKVELLVKVRPPHVVHWKHVTRLNMPSIQHDIDIWVGRNHGNPYMTLSNQRGIKERIGIWVHRCYFLQAREGLAEPRVRLECIP